VTLPAATAAPFGRNPGAIPTGRPPSPDLPCGAVPDRDRRRGADTDIFKHCYLSVFLLAASQCLCDDSGGCRCTLT